MSCYNFCNNTLFVGTVYISGTTCNGGPGAFYLNYGECLCIDTSLPYITCGNATLSGSCFIAPTPSPTASITPTPTITQTSTPTNTPTNTSSVTPTVTPTNTATPTQTITSTPTQTNTPSLSFTGGCRTFEATKLSTFQLQGVVNFTDCNGFADFVYVENPPNQYPETVQFCALAGSLIYDPTQITISDLGPCIPPTPSITASPTVTPTNTNTPTNSATPTITPSVTPTTSPCVIDCCFNSTGQTTWGNSNISEIDFFDDGSLFIGGVVAFNGQSIIGQSAARIPNCGGITGTTSLISHCTTPFRGVPQTFQLGRQSNGKYIYRNGTNISRRNANFTEDLTFNPIWINGNNSDGINGMWVNNVDEIYFIGKFNILTGNTIQDCTGFTYSSAFNLYKMKPNGGIDNTFTPYVINGVTFAGASEPKISTENDPNGLALMILFSGITGDTTWAPIARITNDGSPDSTFNNLAFSGKAYTSLAGTFCQQNGKYLVFGTFTSISGLTGQDYIVRLNSNGTLDTTFKYTGTTRMTSILDAEQDGFGNYHIVGNFPNRYQKLDSNGNVIFSISFTSGGASSLGTYGCSVYLGGGSSFTFQSGSTYASFLKFDLNGNLNMCPFPSPTPTLTPTLTPTPSLTPTITQTVTPTKTSTPTPSLTPNLCVYAVIVPTPAIIEISWIDCDGNPQSFSGQAASYGVCYRNNSLVITQGTILSQENYCPLTPTPTSTITSTPTNTPTITPTVTLQYNYYNVTQYLNCVQNSSPGAYQIRVPQSFSGTWFCGDDGFQYEFDSNQTPPYSYTITALSSASSCAGLPC